MLNSLVNGKDNAFSRLRLGIAFIVIRKLKSGHLIGAYDSSGNAWLATSYDGIVRVSSGRGMETCQVGGKVLSGGFNCIFTDTCDRIWAGSMRDGLFLYDVGKEDFIPMSSLVFLDGQPITNITEDPYGNIWVTTGTTAVSLRPDGEGSVSPGWFYNIAASGKPCQFSRNVSCYLPDTDEMLFGCSYGLCLFPCNPEKGLERPSSVVLTGMSVNNGPYAACDVNYMDRVVLPHDCNDILLSFSLLDYSTAPGDIYWYRLSGSGRKDAEWNMVSGASPSAALYGLRPGKYVFEVAGQRAGKSGMGSVRSLQIRISPSPWLAWWSVLAYFLAAAGLSWFVFWFVRSRYRMKRRIELQVTRNPDAVGCLIRVLPTTGSVGDYAYLLPTLPLTLSFSGTLSRDMRLFFPCPLDKRQHTFGGVIFQGS